MIIEKHISIWRLLKIIWLRLLLMTLIGLVGAITVIEFGDKDIAISMITPSILGTALSIFLGFRTNSAVDRWNRARGYWSDAIASSLNLARVLARVDGEGYRNNKTGEESALAAHVMQRMIRRNIAWAWVLNRQLKGQAPLQDVEDMIEPQELEILKKHANPAMKLIFNQSPDFRIACHEEQFIDGAHFEIVAMLRQQIAAQVSCEGLKTTPFPTHYSFFTDVFIWMLVVLLAFSLPSVENIGYFSIAAVVIIGWVFSMIDGIGSYMEEPFINNRNVVPMDALSRNLEIQLRQIGLNEDDLPAQIKPIEGALY